MKRKLKETGLIWCLIVLTHELPSLLEQGLCQVQTALPSVKNWALDKDLLCRVPHSAKNSLPSAGHSAKKTLGKGLLCRVPGSRQKCCTRHRLPHVTVFGHVLLCRVPAVSSAKKVYFKKNICRVSQI